MTYSVVDVSMDEASLRTIYTHGCHHNHDFFLLGHPNPERNPSPPFTASALVSVEGTIAFLYPHFGQMRVYRPRSWRSALYCAQGCQFPTHGQCPPATEKITAPKANLLSQPYLILKRKAMKLHVFFHDAMREYTQGLGIHFFVRAMTLRPYRLPMFQNAFSKSSLHRR